MWSCTARNRWATSSRKDCMGGKIGSGFCREKYFGRFGRGEGGKGAGGRKSVKTSVKGLRPSHALRGNFLPSRPPPFPPPEAPTPKKYLPPHGHPHLLAIPPLAHGPGDLQHRVLPAAVVRADVPRGLRGHLRAGAPSRAHGAGALRAV